MLGWWTHVVNCGILRLTKELKILEKYRIRALACLCLTFIIGHMISMYNIPNSYSMFYSRMRLLVNENVTKV